MKAFFWTVLICTVCGFKAHAALMIYTPGKPTTFIEGDGAGYTVVDGEGVTQVLQGQGMSMISRPHGPTEFIFDTNPFQSPAIIPTLPVVPGQDYELSIPYQPTLPGPNGELDL